jgi:hypothetical protein
LLSQHGLPDYVRAKREIRAALAAGHAHGRPSTRIARAALRAAQRQSPYLEHERDDAARA